MNYKEELARFEWQEKRELILERDNYQCIECNQKRSDFLGFDYEFGVLDYVEFTIKGYVVKRSGVNLEKLELSFNNLSIKCDFLIGNLKNVQLNKLKIAKQWREPKNPLMYKINSLELVCFSEDEYVESDFFDLNIHHKYYQVGKKAWEYSNDALVTLCANCHHIEHQTNEIPILDAKGLVIGFANKCDRCDGSGVILDYKYYHNGICFKCNGRGDL